MATALATANEPEPAPTALQGLARMSIVRQLMMLGLLAGAVALGVTVALWSQTPAYDVLYGRDLGDREMSQVLDALRQEGIEFRVAEGSGLIMVPSAVVHEARMKLAAQSLPESTDRGMELLGEQQAFGVSQFRERAQYQRAVEVELERSIASLNGVESARVHLALPRQSAFLKRNQTPSASVILQVAGGRRIEAEQAEGIAYLVGSAVPNMERSRVSVLNGKGHLLTDPEAGSLLGMTRRELDLKREIEGGYVDSIEAILLPLVGPDGVEARVTADVDLSHTERSRESFNPDNPALRSEELVDQSNDGQLAGGIPGALTNQPPGAAQAPEQAGAGQAGGQEIRANAGGRNLRNSRQLRNFELDRAVSYTQTLPGNVRRLSVAVVIDDRRNAGEDGAVNRSARTPEEMAGFTALVKDAIGYDAERGDTVSVVNETFAQPAAEVEVAPRPLWQEPWVWDIARQVGGVLLVLLLAFGVLRPTMRNLVAREVTERELEHARVAGHLPAPGEEGDEGDGDRSGESGEAAGGGLDALSAPAAGADRIEQVRALVNEDPRRVANVVRSWVSDDG